ncbi:hypothetical protein AA103587_1176 [Gluconobacter kanchanaburiensis NBRC 103587]|nr:hypothetical protein AA103587_1176 [Gluconobacter kanchanaburiensis NBRC 103587]
MKSVSGGSHHDGVSGETTRANAFIVLYLLTPVVIRVDHFYITISHGCRRIFPVSRRILFPCLDVRTHDDQCGTVLNLRLIPGGSPDPATLLPILHYKKPAMLDIESRRGMAGSVQNGHEGDVFDPVGRIEVLGGTPGRNCMKDIAHSEAPVILWEK